MAGGRLLGWTRRVGRPKGVQKDKSTGRRMNSRRAGARVARRPGEAVARGSEAWGDRRTTATTGSVAASRWEPAGVLGPAGWRPENRGPFLSWILGPDRTLAKTGPAVRGSVPGRATRPTDRARPDRPRATTGPGPWPAPGSRPARGRASPGYFASFSGGVRGFARMEALPASSHAPPGSSHIKPRGAPAPGGPSRGRPPGAAATPQAGPGSGDRTVAGGGP